MLNSGKLLVAISGGLDSITLAHLCCKLDLDVTFAHCNFNLRGQESDSDEAFVSQFAKDLNVECFIERFDTLGFAKSQKTSTQMAARKLRYDWFKELADDMQFDYILTAHHADDNLETFLINLSRGTGLEGLTGIPEINNNIVRPLLTFTRDEIETYAKANDLKWREDSSNASTKYLRNKLRHEVIPILKEINPQLLQNFNKTQRYLQDSSGIIYDSIEAISDTIITEVNAESIKFDIAKIEALNNPKAYLYELLKDYNFTEWNDVYDLLSAQSGKQILSATHRLIKNREHLLLSEINLNDIREESHQIITINSEEKQAETPFGTLHFDEADAIFGKRTNVIFVDKSKLISPLTLRQWEEGDVFYPLGMQGKKKLSKYFKDEKLSLIDKEHVWLLCSRNDIVWVINRRADDRFKVDKNTNQIIKIELH